MTIYDILFKKGEHEGKGIWQKCGVLLEKEDGRKSIKLDLLPLSRDWDGWLVVSERRARDGEGQGQAAPPIIGGEDVPF